jgi:hypothetical protein
MNTPIEGDIRNAFEAVRYNVPVSRIVSGARRRQHRRRIAMGALPAAGLLAAGGYAVTHREINDPRALGCSTQFDQLGDMTIIGRVEGETPIETCLRVMKHTGDWSFAPVNPVECVTNYPNGDGGALVVFPAPEGMSQEEACRTLGAALPPEGSP